VFGSLQIDRDGASESHTLTQTATGLGRDPQNEVRLDDPKVSRFHARIVSSAAGCQVVDLGSANGTHLDGLELDPRVGYPLDDGALVEIGPFSLRFIGPSTPGEKPELPGGGASRRAAPAGSPSGGSPAPPAGEEAPQPARLVVTTPAGTSEHALRGDRLTLGRDPTNDLVIDADTVSRRHAVLERRGPTWEIADLGSANGLQTAQGETDRLLLADGDTFFIGQSVRLEFRQAAPVRGPVQAAAQAAAAQPAAQAAWPPASLQAPGQAQSAAAQEFDLAPNASLVLGRGENADVVLSHPQVSKAHARIVRTDAGLVVEDLGSSTGTYVNGAPVKERALAEGDIVRVGTSRLLLTQGKLQMLNEEGNLRVDALHLSRVVGKGLRILQDVSLSILPQEFVAIVGGSGSGKTTLLNALCGFHPATGGTVLLNGIDLYQSFSAYRNDFGYVPQDDIIHRELPVLRALTYAAELRMPRDTTPVEHQRRVAEVLQQLDIPKCADQAVRQLSGGPRKRVSMGVELLTRPSLFFLDEATSGLDPGTESQMMRLLRRLADEGRTVVLVTHATKNVMTCDKVVFLARGGHLAYFGDPGEALRYFDVDDFDEIYTRLEEGRPDDWGRRFRGSAAYLENVEARLAAMPRPPARAMSAPGARLPAGIPMAPATAPAPAAAATAAAASAAMAAPAVLLPAPVMAPPPAPRPVAARPAHLRQVSGFRQFQILCKRQLDTIWGDKKTAIMLLAIAPFLGILDFLIWKRDMFDARTGSATQVVMMFFIEAIITILIGCITSVREIVKEDAIYRRERMVGLGVLPFVASKAAVGFMFAVYSAVMLFVFMVASVSFSHLTAVQTLSLLGPLVLGTFAGVMWGLLVSALAPTEDRAMLLIIVVLVPQFVFSGGVIPMKDIGFAGTVLGWLTSARWELGALVTSARVDTGPAMNLQNMSLPGMQGLPALDQQGLSTSLADQYGKIFHVNVGFYWLMALVLSLALFLVVLYVQKRKDTL
jgi:ABC transport system ATP-binding/permease protein